jgi:hypothetical protein
MVGYMACSLLLREGDDLLRLIINSIKVRGRRTRRQTETDRQTDRQTETDRQTDR